MGRSGRIFQKIKIDRVPGVFEYSLESFHFSIEWGVRKKFKGNQSGIHVATSTEQSTVPFHKVCSFTNQVQGVIIGFC